MESFETSRLRIRNYEVIDVEDLFEFASDNRFTEVLPWESHKEKDDTLNRINYCIEQNMIENTTRKFWVIELKNEKKVVGTIDLILDWSNKVAEIAYGINPKYWGQGLTVEACQPLVNYAFNTLLFNRVQAKCLAVNTQSSRVMEKLGMEFEGVRKKAVYRKGKVHDVLEYAIVNKVLFEDN